jgi:hypothetical protein
VEDLGMFSLAFERSDQRKTELLSVTSSAVSRGFSLFFKVTKVINVYRAGRLVRPKLCKYLKATSTEAKVK